MSITSLTASGSSSTTDATMKRADADPTAPASRVSTWCTRSASASGIRRDVGADARAA